MTFAEGPLIELRVCTRVLGRQANCSRQGALQVVCGTWLVQPTFVVGNDCRGAHQPDAWLLFLDQYLTTGKLFAQRNLTIGAYDFDSGVVCKG